jgi:hypothetical protein
MSPEFINAANDAQSASVTPQLLASMSLLSKSNSLQPNFTFAMIFFIEAAAPTVRQVVGSKNLAAKLFDPLLHHPTRCG